MMNSSDDTNSGSVSKYLMIDHHEQPEHLEEWRYKRLQQQQQQQSQEQKQSPIQLINPQSDSASDIHFPRSQNQSYSPIKRAPANTSNNNNNNKKLLSLRRINNRMLSQPYFDMATFNSIFSDENDLNTNLNTLQSTTTNNKSTSTQSGSTTRTGAAVSLTSVTPPSLVSFQSSFQIPITQFSSSTPSSTSQQIPGNLSKNQFNLNSNTLPQSTAVSSDFDQSQSPNRLIKVKTQAYNVPPSLTLLHEFKPGKNFENPETIKIRNVHKLVDRIVSDKIIRIMSTTETSPSKSSNDQPAMQQNPQNSTEISVAQKQQQKQESIQRTSTPSLNKLRDSLSITTVDGFKNVRKFLKFRDHSIIDEQKMQQASNSRIVATLEQHKTILNFNSHEDTQLLKRNNIISDYIVQQRECITEFNRINKTITKKKELSISIRKEITNRHLYLKECDTKKEYLNSKILSLKQAKKKQASLIKKPHSSTKIPIDELSPSRQDSPQTRILSSHELQLEIKSINQQLSELACIPERVEKEISEMELQIENEITKEIAQLKLSRNQVQQRLISSCTRMLQSDLIEGAKSAFNSNQNISFVDIIKSILQAETQLERIQFPPSIIDDQSAIFIQKAARLEEQIDILKDRLHNLNCSIQKEQSNTSRRSVNSDIELGSNPYFNNGSIKQQVD